MYILAFLILMAALGLTMFLYLEGYFSCSPLGAIFVLQVEEQELQNTYPELKSLYTRWVKLKTDLIHQEWKWDKVTRPTHPVRAFTYRFIFPNRLQKKINLCDQARSEYVMCLKLLNDF